jgi:hypothetical protein
MNENFSGMNSENRVFRPVNSVLIGGANNRTYIYSSVNSIQVNGLNQLIYCNYTNSRVNSIRLNGMNNIVYINRNSNLCVQDVNGANNRIILTDIQNDNNNHIDNYNNNMINSNNNIQNRLDIGAPISNRNLEHSAALIRGNLNINNSNLNLNHDYPSAPINMNVENEFIYEKRYEHDDIIEDDKCNICNIKFNNNDTIKKMQCGHIYHKFCLDKFLERQINRDNNTPLCLICFQWEMQDNINRRNA